MFGELRICELRGFPQMSESMLAPTGFAVWAFAVQ